MASLESHGRSVPASVISRAVEKSFNSADGLLDRLPVGISICDIDGTLVQYNQRAASLWGDAPVLGAPENRFCGAHKAYRLDGTPVEHDESPMALLLQTGEPQRDSELVIERADGTRVTILANLDPLLDDDGNLVGGVSCFQDITERKRAEAEKTVLLRELAHRVNNTFAVIFAITQQSLRTATSPQAFAESFTGRLQALARAHNLLLARDWGGASLSELASTQLAVSCPEMNERVKLEGPLVMLSPAEVVGLGALLHELGANACKYGALSADTGKVDLTWKIRPNVSGEFIDINWVESGGPPVSPPSQRGLGSRLIERGLATAKVDWCFEPEGLLCTIELKHERRNAGREDDTHGEEYGEPDSSGTHSGH